MWMLLCLLVLTVLHAIVVIAEYAFVRMSRTEVSSNLVNTRSVHSLKMSQDLEEFLTLCQLLRTTTLLAMGVLLGRLLTSGGEMDDTTVHQILLGDHSHFIVAFGVMLLVHQVVGCEIAKAVGITLSASRAESLSRPMLMLQYSFKPVLWLISQLKRSIIQLL